MLKQIKEILDDNDMFIISEENDLVEIEFWSDKGEDFIFCVDKNNFIKDFNEYAEDFDEEEHAVMWWNVKDTVSGVPQSIIALLHDAKGIKERLETVAKSLLKVQVC